VLYLATVATNAEPIDALESQRTPAKLVIV
jgi:hypothetical protein